MTFVAKKTARAFQPLAEDELGIRPKLTTCYNILRESPEKAAEQSREEHLAALFVAHEATLRESAEKRAEVKA